MARELRRKGNSIVREDRRWFRFMLNDGRVAETKAITAEEAKKYIENCLGTELKKAA